LGRADSDFAGALSEEDEIQVAVVRGQGEVAKHYPTSEVALEISL
jgi:hypothetical protein